MSTEVEKIVQGGSFCPNEGCPDLGKVDAGNLIYFGHTKAGTQRRLCKTCGGTFTVTRGTIFYRRRTPQKEIVEALAQLAERGSIAAVARVKAVLRRAHRPEETITATLTCGELETNFARRTVRVRGENVSLTRTEYALLRQLALNANKVMLHQDLLTQVWGQEYRGDIDYLRAYIRYLRRKLEVDPSNPCHILTSPGVGYMLACPDESCN